MTIKSYDSISIIIPVYNEIDQIYRLVKHLEKFKNQAEIIFVDGGSEDGSFEAIADSGYSVLKSEEKGRANQMNYGVKHSNGDILFFLHVDSILEDNALEKIKRAINLGNRVGCFRIRFASSHPIMKICGFMSNLRVVLRNIAFGDQGIFIRRDYFLSLGGYRKIPLMEDYQLSMDINKDGEKIYLLKSKIISSERRFVKNGRLRTMARMQRLQHMYRKGEDIDLIASLYK